MCSDHIFTVTPCQWPHFYTNTLMVTTFLHQPLVVTTFLHQPSSGDPPVLHIAPHLISLLASSLAVFSRVWRCQWSPMQCSAVTCSAVQGSLVQCLEPSCAVIFSAVLYILFQCLTMIYQAWFDHVKVWPTPVLALRNLWHNLHMFLEILKFRVINKTKNI